VCETCGCSDAGGVRVGIPGQRVAGGGNDHDHPHDADHADHAHVHHHPAETRTITLEQNVLAKNDALAAAVQHDDLLRLPLFGLMLIVIGEFTALVVIYVDGVVPYTCRIPKQIATGLQKAEDRRRSAFDELEARFPHGVLSPRVTPGVARNHVLRSLHLAGTMWDRLGFIPPGMWQVKGRLRMAFLEGDDRNLIEDGGPSQLEPEELRIACAERGIDVVGRSETELRGVLGDWLRLTAAEDITERRRRMATLLLTRYVFCFSNPVSEAGSGDVRRCRANVCV